MSIQPQASPLWLTMSPAKYFILVMRILTMKAANLEEIYIPLLDEGVDVWRPTLAQRLIDGSHLVLQTPNYDPEDEKWEFPPGSRVICEPKRLSRGRVLAAVRFAPAKRKTA